MEFNNICGKCYLGLYERIIFFNYVTCDVILFIKFMKFALVKTANTGLYIYIGGVNFYYIKV